MGRALDDVQFVADLLDDLRRALCVDPARVFVTGKSEGGGLTALPACRLPTRIAAFGTVSGAFYPGPAGIARAAIRYRRWTSTAQVTG